MDEVGFEFGDHSQNIEEEFVDGVSGVVAGSVEAELDIVLGEVFDDAARVGQGTREAV